MYVGLAFSPCVWMGFLQVQFPHAVQKHAVRGTKIFQISWNKFIWFMNTPCWKTCLEIPSMLSLPRTKKISSVTINRTYKEHWPSIRTRSCPKWWQCIPVTLHTNSPPNTKLTFKLIDIWKMSPRSGFKPPLRHTCNWEFWAPPPTWLSASGCMQEVQGGTA